MNITKTCHKLLLIILLPFLVYQAKAQTADSATYSKKQTYFWGGAHIGGGSYTFNGGFDAAILLHNTFVMGFDISNNVNILDHGYNKGADDYSLLFGFKLTHQRKCNLMFLTGVSYTEVFQNINTTTVLPSVGIYTPTLILYGKTFPTVGIPITLKYLIAPVNFMAFDFSASANVNSHNSYFALTFGVIFGKVRNRVQVPPVKA